MWNQPPKEQLAKIPKLYETERVPLKEKLIWLHFFLGAFDWYIAEYDGKHLFWGYVILTGDFERTDWGYISFRDVERYLARLKPQCGGVDREGSICDTTLRKEVVSQISLSCRFPRA